MQRHSYARRRSTCGRRSMAMAMAGVLRRNTSGVWELMVFHATVCSTGDTPTRLACPRTPVAMRIFSLAQWEKEKEARSDRRLSYCGCPPESGKTNTKTGGLQGALRYLRKHHCAATASISHCSVEEEDHLALKPPHQTHTTPRSYTRRVAHRRCISCALSIFPISCSVMLCLLRQVIIIVAEQEAPSLSIPPPGPGPKIWSIHVRPSSLPSSVCLCTTVSRRYTA